MKNPERIVIEYVRHMKDGNYKEQSIGFGYDSDYSISDNIDFVVDFVKTFHDVHSVLCVVLEY